MKSAVSTIKINDVEKTVNIEADDIAFGNNEIWFTGDNPPGSDADWKDIGYTVQNFLTPEEHNTFRERVAQGMETTLSNYGIDTTGFTLDKYHNYVTNAQHLAFINTIRAGSDGTGGLLYECLPVPLERIEKRISEICNTKVAAVKTFLMGDGSFYTTNHFWIRVVRPQSFNDNNLPHKDVHIERIGPEGRKAVNLYFPLAGSNENSSLPIIPGSHLWPESDIERTHGNVFSNGVKFTNPAIVSTKNGLNLVTPNPGSDQAMVFTPYAIHGGGFNFNTDVTRISLEMRFWRAE